MGGREDELPLDAIRPPFIRLTSALDASEQLPYLYSFWPFDQFHSETDGSKMGVFALEKAFLTGQRIRQAQEHELRNTKFKWEASVKCRKKCSAFCRPLLLAAAVGLLVSPAARSQTNSGGLGDISCSGSGSAITNDKSSASVISAGGSENHYTWIEQFEGSSNTQGQVMLLDSSAGYVFGRHLFVDGGIPVYFVRATTTTSTGSSTTNSFTALGDFYGRFRLSFPNPMLNLKTQLTGRAATGNTSDGISTGHATYDWTNRIDRGFGNWTPFFEAGLADSIPDTFIYRRSFASYGNLAHFQLGAQYRATQWFSVAASAFDVAPWGTQTIETRGKSTKVTGGSSLAADNGFSAGVDLAPARAIDFTVAYSRSTHYGLNTISFGVAVNMRDILRRPSL